MFPNVKALEIKTRLQKYKLKIFQKWPNLNTFKMNKKMKEFCQRLRYFQRDRQIKMDLWLI